MRKLDQDSGIGLSDLPAEYDRGLGHHPSGPRARETRRIGLPDTNLQAGEGTIHRARSTPNWRRMLSDEY